MTKAVDRGVNRGVNRGVLGSAVAAWRRFAERRAATALMFGWAVGEATVWPVPADFLLAALLLGRRRRWPVLLPACVAGMAAGGVVALPVARAAPARTLAVVQALPGVTATGLDRARSLVADHGVPGLLLQPVSGVPFKAWAAVLGPADLPLAVAAPTVITARAVRMAAVAVVAVLVARALDRGELAHRCLWTASGVVHR